MKIDTDIYEVMYNQEIEASTYRKLTYNHKSGNKGRETISSTGTIFNLSGK